MSAGSIDLANEDTRDSQLCSEVMRCSELAGDIDYLLTARTRTFQEYSAFTRRQLAADTGVKSFRSLIVLRETKHEHLLAI
jgi:DNA-binding Lrp family transcriptional regulator